MVMGSHRLKGKVETLKQPFCVLRKDVDSDNDTTSYQVTGIITKKLLFNQYPKTIMR